jgi:DNA-binding NtrC family response regulator
LRQAGITKKSQGKMRTVLVVDDENTQRKLIGAAIERDGYRVLTADGGQAAIDLLNGPDGNSIGAMLLDLSMPGVGGLDVLHDVRPKRPRLPVIVLTAHSSLSNAVESMRAGATDFLVKPASAERLRIALASAFNDKIADGELRPLTEKLSKELRFDQLVGKAPRFEEAVALAQRAATASIPVLIEGESGVGKELFAQSIKSASARKNAPFITVNCGAIPANLIESILFGHEKGAFTGASDKHVGKFTDADGGTLFLDEIGELPLDLQVKLLRVLQEGEVQPIGSRVTQKVDVRVISATNRDLSAEVAAGRFREDLFYRLNVVSIYIPSLRDRTADIPALARHFLARIGETENIPVPAMSAEVEDLLSSFDWPGNVRQLQNAIFRAAVLCDADTLGVRDFPQLMTHAQAQRAPAIGAAISHTHGQRPALAKPEQDHTSLPLVGEDNHIRRLSDIEADVIRTALDFYKGRMSEVARRLGIGRSTLYRKLAELGIEEVV